MPVALIVVVVALIVVVIVVARCSSQIYLQRVASKTASIVRKGKSCGGIVELPHVACNFYM